jgi:hypothetical protein
MNDTSQSHIDRRHFLIGGVVIGTGLYVGMRFAETASLPHRRGRHIQAQRLRAR